MNTPIVRFGTREIAQESIRRDAAVVASGLSSEGVKPGERVALIMRNDPNFLMLSLACALVGALPVPVNWHWRGDELRHVLLDSGARAVFVHRDFRSAVSELLPDGVRLIEVTALDASTSSEEPGRNITTLQDWLRTHEPYAEGVGGTPQSLVYTSGTTGLPKGVVRNAMSPEESTQVATATLAAQGLSSGMSTIVTAPLYHAAPNAQGLFALALGIDLTIMPRFDPEEFLRLVQAHQISHAQMVPTMFIRLLDLPANTRNYYDISSLRAVVHAAAPCPVHVKRRMIDWFGPIILEYYGGTESGIVATSDSRQWLAHEGTVGSAVDGADIRVIGSDGTVLGRGETGEIFVKPPKFWPGFTYLGHQTERRVRDPDGYLSLGDVGRLDADGFLFLSDRARDIVISGGVNIYPIEIESCLLELAGVRDVAVFGIPDDTFGEALAAHVEVAPEAGLDADAIRDHVRRRLAGYKVPREVVLDDNLPREESGKIFKRRIRESYWDNAGRNI